jgi:thiol:disulfide interchange protein
MNRPLVLANALILALIGAGSLFVVWPGSARPPRRLKHYPYHAEVLKRLNAEGQSALIICEANWMMHTTAFEIDNRLLRDDMQHEIAVRRLVILHADVTSDEALHRELSALAGRKDLGVPSLIVAPAPREGTLRSTNDPRTIPETVRSAFTPQDADAVPTRLR